MLKVKCVVKESLINGFGLFADETIHKNQLIWGLDNGIDAVFSKDDIEASSNEIGRFMRKYTFSDDGIVWVLCADGARFVNHSDNPNVVSMKGISIASRCIIEGEELTEDYRTFHSLCEKDD